MFLPFVLFVVTSIVGLLYWPFATTLFICAFLLFAVGVIGVDTFGACFMSIFPLQPDYDKYLSLIKGKTVLITGANRGIGRGLAESMVMAQANVIIAGRSELESTVAELREIAKEHKSSSQICSYAVDFSDFLSINKLVLQLQKEEKQIDVLVLNAGVTPMPSQQQKDGIDLMLFVMFISNVIFVDALVERGICRTDAGLPRIVFTSSDTHRWHDYQPLPTTKRWNYTALSLVL
ncbi:retinol dehydrogenase [Reticulomyxa filosa]|uniref:Retinol dehydrogenase n=1 Tax=Reticulomyxa filosa TaxID=46433 RepID=X6N4S1_RETFI|nr:retinol dehydrogenase [Reticulomyxa filosa]|eukprot:ETO21285.1 retinol dehydrogenase [Reticulomyxa filosa]